MGAWEDQSVGGTKQPNTDPQKSAQPCGCDEAAGHVCANCLATVRIVQPSPYSDKSAGLQGLPSAKIETGEWGVIPGIKDSGKRVVYSSGAMRDPSTGKIDWTRVTFGPLLRRWAMHLTKAEAKYPDPEPGVPNFSLIKTKEELIRYKKSAFRHFMSWYFDETDEDHAAATTFNINGVEIIKAKMRGESIDGIPYTKPAVEWCSNGRLIGEAGKELRHFDCARERGHSGECDSPRAQEFRAETAKGSSMLAHDWKLNS
jgi:hypothetical protein